ncbi:hypothetical protein BOSE62_71063 [Bosea sp. 62]|nr:hypothetical protein BOSE7B_60083 [Bosea sp. 7B]CAD5297051.1 hypothetical protein BOSE21B_90580 [Bosea sp. 21B]CAD5297338.1 hypothetical protein BOSE46_80663 [Bosea sp. 46]VVT61228.1 hypothetical protein BOS5A_230505 [Bosea sp. EC-HK365B]VXB20350.1 hypothetical protein BOSE125_130187 [Bosea sp. 125]VXB23929.1 hypothetical protein BOSE127_110083 [Bosea sp. 127]VXC80743.1 hypothetical protein BOSE29B_80548 [Bosea sp. 29B]VXC85952.1 hypothetical protein BOSE62_71063 [Bosea sp. 62]
MVARRERFADVLLLRFLVLLVVVLSLEHTLTIVPFQHGSLLSKRGEVASARVRYELLLHRTSNLSGCGITASAWNKIENALRSAAAGILRTGDGRRLLFRGAVEAGGHLRRAPFEFRALLGADGQIPGDAARAVAPAAAGENDGDCRECYAHGCPSFRTAESSRRMGR